MHTTFVSAWFTATVARVSLAVVVVFLAVTSSSLTAAWMALATTKVALTTAWMALRLPLLLQELSLLLQRCLNNS